MVRERFGVITVGDKTREKSKLRSKFRKYWVWNVKIEEPNSRKIHMGK